MMGSATLMLALMLLLFSPVRCWRQFIVSDAKDNTDSFLRVKSWFATSVSQITDTLFGGGCPFVEDPVRSLELTLAARIRAQAPAIEAIVGAFSAWNLDRTAGGVERPLVLAFTGPTGVGKTETAYAIGEAIFRLRDELRSGRQMARGLLLLRGEDYEEADQVSQFKSEIRERLMAHLDSCSGNAVIVFDEVQKVAAGTLDAMLGVMDTGMITRATGGLVHTARAENAVFILISDIGAEAMIETLMRRHADATQARQLVPQQHIRSVVRSALDSQWERLRFGKMVERVVPFLPLAPVHITEVVRMKLRDLGQQLEGILWAVFAFDDPIPTYLAGQQFIQYEVHEDAGKQRRHIYAKYGGRSVVTGGPISLLKTLLSRLVRPNRECRCLYVKPHDAVAGLEEAGSAILLQDARVVLRWMAEVTPPQYQRQQKSLSPEAGKGPLALLVCDSSLPNVPCTEVWLGQLEAV